MFVSGYLYTSQGGERGMERNLEEIIALAKELPERYWDEAFDKIKVVKEKAEAEEEADRKSCPKCGSREGGATGINVRSRPICAGVAGRVLFRRRVLPLRTPTAARWSGSR
jgi:hypothetical protein